MVLAIQENYFITFNYHRQVTRNLELARQTLESWAQKYPRDLNPTDSCRASHRTGTGHYDRAVEEGLKAIELDPDFSIGYENVALAYIYLNRLPEAEALLHKASERKIEVIQFSLCRYFIAFLRSDKAAMEREMIQRQAKLARSGMVRAPGSSDLGVSGATERSKSVIGARGTLGSPGRFAGAGRSVSRRSCGVECAVRESGGGAKKRRGSVVAFPRPGCRLWTCLCARASRRFRASPQDRGGT